MSDKAKHFFRTLFGRKLVIVSAIIILFFILCALASPLLATHEPNKINLSEFLQGASKQHWLGTDQHGRDVYSRIVYGSRMAFLIGILSVISSGIIGSLIGLISGFFGGLVDDVLMRITEAMMAIPTLILALALVAMLGRSVTMLTVVLGISNIPPFARMMRGQVLSVRDLDFVAASRIRGNKNFVTMIKHILPNCLSPMIVIMTQSIGGTILSEAALSFLGAGIEPPRASWGTMVNDGYRYLESNSLFALAPGVAIILLVLAFNIFGDGLRDALDPRLRDAL